MGPNAQSDLFARRHTIPLVLSRMKTITVSEVSEYDACKAINEELKKYFENGWVGGNAVCLEEQKYNTYTLERDGQEMKLRFDMSPMVHRLGLNFTIMSMSLTNPSVGFEGIKKMSIISGDPSALRDQGFYKRYLAPIVERILGFVFIIFIFWSVAQCVGD